MAPNLMTTIDDDDDEVDDDDDDVSNDGLLMRTELHSLQICTSALWFGFGCRSTHIESHLVTLGAGSMCEKPRMFDPLIGYVLHE